MPISNPVHRRWIQGLTVAMLFAAVFLMSHPFTGVRHDGTLYAGEALAKLLPGEFRDDLYFYFGSQGRFTLLPTLYAGLISAFGLGSGTIVGMLVAFALYLATTIYLVYGLAPSRLRNVCVLSVVLGWTLYGGNRIFAYSEPFLTARSFAEPAVLLGLGLLVRRRTAFAICILLAAAVIHPLLASGGILIAWTWLSMKNRRYLWIGVFGIVLLVVLGASRLGPFSDVFTRYDPQWLELVHEANGHAFVLRWFAADYGLIVYELTVLWFVSRVTDNKTVSDMIVATTIATVVSLLASLLLVDIIGNPFFGKLQLWRTQWLLQWLAMALLPIAVVGLWKRGEHGRIAAWLLATGWIAMFTYTPAIVALMAVVIYSISNRTVITPTTTRICGAVVIVAALAIAVQYEFRVFKFGEILSLPLMQVAGQALSMNILLLVGAVYFLHVEARIGWFAPIVALVVVAAGVAVWDQRGPWTRKLEAYAPGAHIWPGLIEPKATVYWYRDLIAPWVLLGHGNYYTQQQGSGAVFSRDMVLELDRRRRVTAILDFQEQVCRLMNNLSEKAGSCEPDAEAVKTVCLEGGIDYVVLQSTLERNKPIAEFSTSVVENGYEKKFFLYRCSALKSG